MFGTISHTFELMKESWELLKQDKELLLFPLISGICCIIVTASFIIPMVASDSWAPPGVEISSTEQSEAYTEPTTADYVSYYSKLFIFYFVNYFIIIFFNSAVIGCAAMRMQGEDPSIADGFRIAGSRIISILGWALVSATVGLILRMIEDKSKNIGRFVAGLLGAVWSFITFLVLPVLIIENKNPLTAIKDSAVMLKQTWGRQLASNFSFGLVFFLLNIPAIILIVLGVMSQNPPLMFVLIAIAVIYIIVLALIQSVLVTIFQTALYHYAKGEQMGSGFDASLLEDAIYEK